MRYIMIISLFFMGFSAHAQQSALSLKSAIAGDQCSEALVASGGLASAQKIDKDLGAAWKKLGLPAYQNVFVKNFDWVQGVCVRDKLNVYPCVTLVLDNLQKQTDKYIRTNYAEKITPAADKVLPIFVLANAGIQTRKACEGLYALCKKGQKLGANQTFESQESREKAAQCITLNMMNIVYTENINSWTKLTADNIVGLLQK